jgi:putative endonuclease
VGRESEKRIVGAADLWLAKHPDAGALDLRFDMVLVTPWQLPQHLPDAFRPRLGAGLVRCAAIASGWPAG